MASEANVPEKVINTELIKAQIFSEKEAKPGISNAENSVLHQQVVLCGLVSQAFSLHLNESIHAASVICLQVQCGYTSYITHTICIREGTQKKIDFFKEKVLNYGWVGVKSPKLFSENISHVYMVY